MKLLEEKINRFFEKVHLKPYIDYHKGKKDKNKYGHSEKKRIFLMLVPGYGNLGDQAIAQASIKYIRDNYPEYELVINPLWSRFYCAGAVKSVIKPDDIIFIQGGGNFGNLYMYIEESRRFIVSHFHDNKIVSLPVTINYQDNKKGRRELRKSMRIFGAHKDFTIISRDKTSFEFAKKHFCKAKNILCPDMVFYLWDKETNHSVKRTDIGICLRIDPEKLKTIDRAAILKAVSDKTENWKIFDTQLFRPIREDIRDYEITAIKREIADCKVVITDRLHGMVLSVITGTPCIVLPTQNDKTKDSYDWISSLDYVRFIDEFDVAKIMETVDELSECNTTQYIDFKTEQFNNLRKKIFE